MEYFCKGERLLNFFPIYQVDAFTNQMFQGNPAAVCVLSSPVSDDWMQKVAREMNLSETAFLLKYEEGYNLRWFTPTTEVSLCGHATLASAHVLWSEHYLESNQEAKFYTRSGVLVARRLEDWIELDFPLKPVRETTTPQGLIEALGIDKAVSIGKSDSNYVIEVDSPQVIRSLCPDFPRLTQIGHEGYIVTSLSDKPDFDFISRYFDPAEGINEDPVTGSAHCSLAPFWSVRMGKKEFIAYQASERGGVLKLKLNGDRVLIRGQAVTVLRGELGLQ